MKILITGGAGFIGSAVARGAVRKQPFESADVHSLGGDAQLDGLRRLASEVVRPLSHELAETAPRWAEGASSPWRATID